MSSEPTDADALRRTREGASAAAVVVDAVRVKEKPANIWSDGWRDLRKRPTFWIALLVVFVVLLMAVWPTLFTQTPPNDNCQLANSNGGPAEGHPLGFTFQGCDIWARIVWGARPRSRSA